MSHLSLTHREDPLAAYRDAAAQLLAAFRQPGVLEETFEVPIGPVPGVAAARLRLVETLVHGWDLAQAIGRTLSFSDDAAQEALDFTRGALTRIPPGRAFSPPQPVADDAPPLDRLAALLGRPVQPATASA